MEQRQIIEWLRTKAETVATTSDYTLSISSKVARAKWPDGRAVGCGTDIAAKTQINAALDVVAWHIHEGSPDPTVNVVVGCAESSEVAQALRTLRAEISHPTINLHRAMLSEGHTAPVTDDLPPPDFADSKDATRWAGYLAGWTKAVPPALAAAFHAAVGDDAVRLYPMLSQSPVKGRWSIRVDGLEVGRVSAAAGVLGVGRDGKTGKQGVARAAWVPIAGPQPVAFDLTTVEPAAAHVRDFIAKLRVGTGADAVLRHGQAEHALESRIVRGVTPVTVAGTTLSLAFDDPVVSRGSQLPTKWGLDAGRARYLDGLLKSGSTPWAIEMKVQEGGGFASYYRHAIGQAVLYRHFIRTATPMHAWFAEHGMNAADCRAAVVFPKTPAKVKDKIDRLKVLAERFDVEVAEVDLPGVAAT